MISNLEKVIEFNTCFNHKVSNKEYLDIFEKEPKLVDLRLKLIKEEITELIEAFMDNNIIEIIDALSDILYVVYGLCACFGIKGNKNYKNFILSMLDQNMNDNEKYMIENMTNFERTKHLYDYKNKNNGNLKKPILKEYTKNINDDKYKKDLQKLLNMINNNYQDLELSVEDQDFEQIVEYVMLLLHNTYLFGVKIGVNLDDSFTIVHDSNMTKICNSEELAQQTVAWYKTNDSRYDTPIYSKTQNGYIIINESSGKILKSIKYTPANFSSLLI